MSRSRKHNFVGVTLLATGVVAVLATGGYLYEKPMIMQTRNHQAELGEEYNPYRYFDFLFMAGNSDVEVIGNIDMQKKGTYDIKLHARAQDIPVKVTVTDSKAPEMILKEVRTDMYTEVKPEDFIESIKDAQGYSLEFAKGTELQKAGKSKVTIIAKDEDGNESKATTTLQRIDDTVSPVIKGVESVYELIMGTKLNTENIRVTDDLDLNPTLKVDVSGIDISTEGEHELKVEAEDKSGNVTSMTRPVKVIENPEYSKNIVYLTFDDGPSENTPKILDILKKNNVKATFFVTAQYPKYASYMKDEKEQGHTVALHTYTHDYEKVYKSEKAYFDDLKKIQDYAKKHTGEESHLIRFPGGSSNTVSANYSQGIMSKLTKSVIDKGYQYFDWNVTSSDASGWGVPANDIAKSACVDWGGNLVILMHDTSGKETTVQALPKIIKYYKDRGYEFRALTEDSFPAHHGVNN